MYPFLDVFGILELEGDDMRVPDKFPLGARFHEDRSGSEWVELPDGKVFKLKDESGEMLEMPRLPVGSLIGSLPEATFIRLARDLEASAAAR